MSEWRSTTVREVISHLASGPSPTCEERNASDGEWGLLKTTAATWSGWDESAHKVPPKEYWGQENLVVRPDDVVVTKAGPRHRVGVVVHVPSTRPRLMVSGKMVLLRPDPEAIEPRLLAGLLATPEAQKYLDDRTTGMAESQTNFANSSLLSTPILVPPLEEQRRIAEVLDTTDDTIRAIERIIDKLTTTEEAVLQQTIDFDGKRSLLGDVCSLIQDGTHLPPTRTADGPLLLSVQNLHAGRLVQTSKDTHVPETFWRGTRASLPIAPGDVCLAVVGATLGKSGVVPDNLPPFTVQRSITVLRGDPRRMLTDFLFAVVRHGEFQRQLWQRANQTAQPGIYLGELRAIQIPTPSIEDQGRVCHALSDARLRREAELRSLDKLRRTRAGLASDLLSGRVRTVPT